MGNLYILYFFLGVYIVRASTSDECPGACSQGKEPLKYCTSPLQCVTCPSGTFNDGYLRFGEQCSHWKTCLKEHMIVATQGSATRDVTCGCEEGYIMSGSVYECYKKSVEDTTDTTVNTTGQTPIPSTKEIRLVPILVPLLVTLAVVCTLIGMGFAANKKWQLRAKVGRLCTCRVPGGTNRGETELVNQSPVTEEAPEESQGSSETSPLRGQGPDEEKTRSTESQGSSETSPLRGRGPDEEKTHSTVAPHYRRSPPIINQTSLTFTRVLCPLSGRHARKQPAPGAFQTSPVSLPQSPPVNGTSTTSSELNLDKIFWNKLDVFQKRLNIDATLRIQLGSKDVITPEMLDILQTMTNDEKVLHLMTKQLPKRGRHNQAMFLRCLIETDQLHILEEIGITLEDIDFYRNYE